MRRVASTVALPFSRSSSIPVETGKARGSKNISWAGIPYLIAALYARLAMANFLSAVRPIPSSSIVPTTIPAPYFLANSNTW